MTPIFIVGSPRTGTHWLRRVLSEHESVVSNPYESHVFPLILGPFLHSRLPWNRSWQRVNKNYTNSYLSKWISADKFFSLQKEYRSMKKEKIVKASLLAKSILEQYYENHKNDKSHYLLEKSPNHVYYLHTINELFESPKIIEMHRHPIDVMKSLKVLSLKEEAWVPKKLSKAVNIWTNAVETGLQSRNYAAGNNILSVKYENLISNFVSAVEEIACFLNIDFEPTALKKIESKYERTGDGGQSGIHPLNNKEYGYIKEKTFSLCKKLNYEFNTY